jgi:hypothetical protein
MKGTSMSDYDFSGLSSRSFEQMIQALSLKILGPGVIIFGDGPDGGREATYQGCLKSYPAEKECWGGYIVIQAKFCQRPKNDTKADTNWLIGQLEKELKNFANSKKKRKKPEYYILATNIVLSSVPKKGGKDKISKLIKSYAAKVPMKGSSIWDYDQICRYLDGDQDVRNAYRAWITPGDVLASIIKHFSSQCPNFITVMTNFLQKELLEDQYSKLEQAGHSPENRIPLEKVFVDLPSFLIRQAEPPDEKEPLPPGFLDYIMTVGSLRLNASAQLTQFVTGTGILAKENPEPGRYVLIGGPGQGKSTLGQFLCQVYRASLLKDRKKLDLDTNRALQSIKKQCDEQKLNINIARRFPLRVDLARFAKALATQELKISSLLSYIVNQIKNKTNYDVHPDDIRKWLEVYPWIVVFDGLDEVPSSSNRSDVMGAIRDFLIDVASLDSDVMIIATTRPQGYNEEFSPTRYEHQWLAPLSVPRALWYGKCLVDCTYSNNSQRRAEIHGRLKRASEIPATAKLMESPLQVTIMARLLAQISQPPQERYNLFKQYYEIIYRREMEREVEPLSRILRDYKPDVDTIHHRMGLLLQVESERSKHTDATMSLKEFEHAVNDRLIQEGHQTEELDKLTSTIASCAIDRLVFLIPSQSGRIGFEIRSLQEFMAAEALMDASDETVVARLKKIASIPFWRNVFLFAAGRVFADRQYLRNHVAQICAELNDDPVDRLGHYVLTGSRLALALLEDGPARHQPAYGQTLAHNSLRLLNLPSDANTKLLADVYDSKFSSVYEEEITKQVERTPVTSCLNSWELLSHLIARGEIWAQKSANARWPIDVISQTTILLEVVEEVNAEWVGRKTAEMMFNIDANDVIKLFRYRHPDVQERRLQFLDPELRNAMLNHPSRHSFIIKTDFPGLHLGLVSILNEDTSRLYSSFGAIRDAHPTWQVLIESAKFLDDPSHNTLAQALFKIAENFSPVPSFVAPWPLEACIQACQTSDQLELLAAKVKCGDLGTFSQWEAAEKRWVSHGVTVNDFKYMIDERWPFTAEIDKNGFPLAASDSLSYSHRYKSLIQSITALSSSRQHAKLRENFFSLIVNNIKECSDDELISCIDFLVRAIKTNPSVCKFVSYESIRRLSNSGDCVADITTLLDLIGHNVAFCFLHASHVDERFYQKNYERVITVLSAIYTKDNTQRGILRLIAKLIAADRSERLRVPMNFENLISLDDKDMSGPATIINLSRIRLSHEQSLQIAGIIISSSLQSSELIRDALNVYEYYQMGNQNAIIILEELLKKLPGTMIVEKRNVIRLMQDIISRRTSGFDKLEIWKKLELPEGLFELLAD